MNVLAAVSMMIIIDFNIALEGAVCLSVCLCVCVSENLEHPKVEEGASMLVLLLYRVKE